MSRRPWRRCLTCRSVCYWQSDAWVCEGCGQEWTCPESQATPLQRKYAPPGQPLVEVLFTPEEEAEMEADTQAAVAAIEDRAHGISTSISIEAEPVQYGARVRITEIDLGPVGDHREVFNRVMPVEWVESTILKMFGVLSMLRDRQRQDAAAGECDLCNGLRLVYSERHGHRWADSCPRCTPKIKAENARTGTPMLMEAK